MAAICLRLNPTLAGGGRDLTDLAQSGFNLPSSTRHREEEGDLPRNGKGRGKGEEETAEKKEKTTSVS